MDPAERRSAAAAATLTLPVVPLVGAGQYLYTSPPGGVPPRNVDAYNDLMRRMTEALNTCLKSQEPEVSVKSQPKVIPKGRQPLALRPQMPPAELLTSSTDW
jgi:hypothetical protein